MRKKPFNTRARALAAGYRSGLEEKVMKELDKLNAGAEYECFRIPYTVPSSPHFYTPDFLLPNGIVIETKGRFTVEDRKKHLLIKDQMPDIDIRFVFSNSKNKIRKGSKTSYADWCEKNGFQYHDKLVPTNWIHEKPNRKSLKIIKELRNER
jgi:hypothetical protein